MSSRPRAVLVLLLVTPALTIAVIGGMYYDIKALWALGKPWLVVVPLLWHLFVDRQRISWSPMRRGGMGPALAFGIFSIVAMFGAYFLVARRFIDPAMVQDATRPLGLDSKAVYLAGAVYWITANSLLEEYAFRWFMFRKFELALGGDATERVAPGEPVPVTRIGVAAVLLTSLVFVVHHTIAMALFFPWWVNVIASAGIFVGGSVWSWLYLRYRSIWPCYVAHACADVPIFVIGYLLIFG